MNSTQRIISLLKLRNPITSKASIKRTGIYFATITAILFILSQLINRGGTVNLSLAVPIIMMFVTIYATEHDFFPQLKSEMQSILYLTLPANSWEKWLSECIHTFIIFPIKAITPMAIAVAIIIAISSRKIVFNIDTLWITIIFYWISHPLLFFGAAYFKKSINAKLLASTAFIIIFSIAIVFCTMYFLISNGNFDFNQQQMAFENSRVNINLAESSTLSLTVITLIYSVFFWGLSYISLIEVEK